VSRPVACYRPSRRYYLLLLLAVTGVSISAWSGARWPLAWIAAVGFAAPVAALLALLLQPMVEIHETHLKLGRRMIAWRDIRRLDRTGWNAPLVLRLTLAANGGGPQRLTLIYPGDLDACRSLLRHLRRYSREAVLDGVPYTQVWGDNAARPAQPPTQKSLPAAKPPRQLPPPPPVSAARASVPASRHRLLLPEDELEVERLFQRLKAEGRLEQSGTIGQPGGSHGRGEQRGSDEA